MRRPAWRATPSARRRAARSLAAWRRAATVCARDSALRGFPTNYLLSRPPVERVKLCQGRAGAEIVMIQNVAAGARDIEEAQLAGQEQADRGLVGRVEHGPAGPAAAGNFKTEIESGKGLAIGLLELERTQLGPVEPPGRPRDAIRIREGILDGQAHVGRRKLRQHRAVGELDKG